MLRPFMLAVLFAGFVLASQPWNRNPDTWTKKDAERILNASPWAQATQASFADDDMREPPPPGPLPGAEQAGMAGPRGASDGRWDGGIGRMPRGSLPSLPVLIRWDSALPVREAALRLQETNFATTEQAAKDYIITVVGLVPAKRYRDAGQLNGTSASDSSVDERDPEELLEGFMSTSRLIRAGRPALAPENVKLDGSTGVVRIFFLKADPIDVREKEVVFRTRFGSLTVQKVFRPAEMTYRGRLEL